MCQPGGRTLSSAEQRYGFGSASLKLSSVPEIVSNNFALLGAAVVAGIGLLIVIARLARGGGSRSAATMPDLRIDLASLSDQGPDEGAARMEFYNTPVRLGVLVVAPLGRGHELPSNEELARIVNNAVPNLLSVINTHRPVLRRWPAQLSGKGFAHAFFINVALPGDRGKGTRWCAIAGKFTADGRPFLAGLACCAADANGLGQVVVEHEGQWLDVLRIRTGSNE